MDDRCCPCLFVYMLFKNYFLHKFLIEIFFLPSKSANGKKAIPSKILQKLENKMAPCIMNINNGGEDGQ
jgi:hypothetical protein